MRNAREASFGVKGAKLFNLLPKDIRGVTSEKVKTFKTVLDEFLRRIPDQPTVPGRARAAETNSLRTPSNPSDEPRPAELSRRYKNIILVDSNAGDQTDIINRVNAY